MFGQVPTHQLYIAIEHQLDQNLSADLQVLLHEPRVDDRRVRQEEGPRQAGGGQLFICVVKYIEHLFIFFIGCWTVNMANVDCKTSKYTLKIKWDRTGRKSKEYRKCLRLCRSHKSTIACIEEGKRHEGLSNGNIGFKTGDNSFCTTGSNLYRVYYTL